MGAWELVISGLIALIFTFFFIGFEIPDDKRYVAFKMVFLWLGFTLIMPFLWICKLIAEPHIQEVGNIFKTLLLIYFPLYGLFVWIIFLAFFKDVLMFFKESIKGFKGTGEEEDTFIQR